LYIVVFGLSVGIGIHIEDEIGYFDENLSQKTNNIQISFWFDSSWLEIIPLERNS